MGPEDQQVLMDKIAAFAGTAAPGDEMTLSLMLTSYDWRLVHRRLASVIDISSTSTMQLIVSLLLTDGMG